MGMVLVLRRVDAAQIAALRANPDDAAEFTIEDEEASEAGDCIDFDKAWHALHFLFTGSADENNAPLSLLRSDGELIGDDIGYGPVRYLAPAIVARFRDALAAVSDDQLHERYDPGAMERDDVYLADMFLEEGEESWGYIIQSLPKLRVLADRCVATQAGLLAVIT
jgi:hypothetical protein